jgi:glycerophosphoryl diester phosphodiesterase
MRLRDGLIRYLIYTAAVLGIPLHGMPAQAYDPFASHADRPILIIAHRGVKKFAPENTLPAIEKAIEMKLDYVELDVRTTKDGQLVLMHDADVDRTTNGHGTVRNLTLDEIKKLDAGIRFSPNFKNTRVPTFDEVLHTINGRINIYLDWKDASPAAIAEAILKANARDWVLVLGDPMRLQMLRQKSPKIMLMAEMFSEKDAMALLKTPLKFQAFSPDIAGLTELLTQESHKKGVRVFVDIQTEKESCAVVEKAIALHADAIQTDQPDLILKCLKSIHSPEIPNN